MNFLSGLKAFGHDITKVFSWIGSPAGQQVIQTGGAIVEAVDPGLTPLVNIAEGWIQKAFTVEALAVAANQNANTGADKAELVMQAVTPQVLTYAKDSGLSARTAAQIQAANDAIVAFIKAMTDPNPPSPGLPQPPLQGITLGAQG